MCAHSGLRERRCSDLSLVLSAPRVPSIFPILPSATPLLRGNPPSVIVQTRMPRLREVK